MADDAGMRKAKPLTFAGLTALAQALDSQQARTSFGKLPLSTEKTQPAYRVPKAHRDDGARLYQGAEMAKADVGGKTSPGPAYAFDDQVKYDGMPNWSFGTEVRVGEDKPKYDFYENALFLDQPTEADLSRKPRCRAPKIGTEARFAAGTSDASPGPQYLPAVNRDTLAYKTSEKYSLGVKRGTALKNDTSTPASVGPGRYSPQYSALPSNHQTFPRWTLPKAGRPADDKRRPDRNQTYDTRSAMGAQAHSKNKSGGRAHFGTSTRRQTDRLGTFKDMMQGRVSIKLHHAKW